MVTRQVAVGVGVAYLSWSTWILHIKPATNRQNLGLWQHKQILVCDGTSKQKLTSTIKYTTTLRHPSVIHPSPPQNIRTHTTHALCICLRLCVCVWPGGNDSLQVCTSWPPNVFWNIRTYGIHLHSLCIQLHSLVKHTDIWHTVALPCKTYRHTAHSCIKKPQARLQLWCLVSPDQDLKSTPS